MIVPEIADIIHYALGVIMLGVAAAWAVLLRSMVLTHTRAPYLDRFDRRPHERPRVSVILPARNEEAYIGRCLDSLTDQDYANYEVIAVDDSSTDRTGRIIAQYAERDKRVIHVTAKPKPDGWMGKNWACMQGYGHATGDLLLFTDSDTRHSRGMISLAVAHLLSMRLDALTVIPRLLCPDTWTGATLPVISTFLHTRFSALNVNDPSKRTGYFFGSFFIIRDTVYRIVGAHQGVRQEIIEDGALGGKVKQTGFKIRMVRGDHLIDAVWARDLHTLHHALRRLMVPLYLQSASLAVGIYTAVVFLLLAPFALAAYSAVLYDSVPAVLSWGSAAASAAVYAAAALETRMLRIPLRNALLAPLGCVMVVLGLQSGLLRAKSSSAVSWRGRSYSMKDHAQSSVRI